MKQVEIYTDGGCLKNPNGPGGWACILKYQEHIKALSGKSEDTTNNRMELTAVIKGLYALKEKCIVTLYSDSKYVVDGINKGWAKSWKENNWKKSDGKLALNVDLWNLLLDLCNKHDVTFVWVKGHNGNRYNEYCDELVKKEMNS